MRGTLAVGLLHLLALLPACLYVGVDTRLGPRLSPEVVARIVPGRTTMGEVLALLGPPNEYKRPELTAALLDDRTRLEGALAAAHRAEDVFTWQADQVDGDGTVLLLLNVFRVDSRSDLLVVFFDEAGVVVDLAFAQGIGR